MQTDSVPCSGRAVMMAAGRQAAVLNEDRARSD